MSETVVLPTATIMRHRDGSLKPYTLTYVILDANENLAGDTLHEVHAIDEWGQGRYWFEDSDGLKDMFDVALGNETE